MPPTDLGAGPHEITTLTDSTCWVLCEVPLNSCSQGIEVSEHVGKERQAHMLPWCFYAATRHGTLCIQF